MSLFTLMPYRPGDAARIDMDETVPERLLAGLPQGTAFTAVDRQGVPVACLGWSERDQGLRVWARTARGLGPASLRELWGYAADLFATQADRELTATAPSRVYGRLFARWGFVPVDDDAPHPKLYRRPAE